MALLYSILCLFVSVPTWAANSVTLAEKTTQTISAFQKAKTMREWIDTAPGLSNYERAALRSDSRVEEKLPKISVRTADPGRVYVTVNGEEFDLSYLRQGKMIYRGKTIRVSKDTFLHDLASQVALAMQPHSPPQRQTRALLPSLLLPPSAFAGSIMKGCASKDFFTLPDIFNSPFGFAPPIWIAATAISVIRWGGDRFRNCETQIADLRRILVKNKLAVKNLNCGSDQWGSDRSIEFWTQERKRDRAGEFRTKKFNLDYTNYFAEEEPELRDLAGVTNPAPVPQKLYVFGVRRLNEVRILENNGSDFQEDCRLLNPQSTGKLAQEFLAEKQKIEAYREIFYYIGQYNTCTACREVETKIASPRPPSYFPGVKKPAAHSESSESPKTDSSSAE